MPAARRPSPARRDAPPADRAAAAVEPTPRQLTAAELATELTATTIITRRDGFVGGDGGVSLDRKNGLDPPLAVIAAGPARAGNVYQGTGSPTASCASTRRWCATTASCTRRWRWRRTSSPTPTSRRASTTAR
jgi:hypothetical protein